MTPKGEGSHYITVKKLPALLGRITSKYISDYYCLNCLHSFRSKNKFALYTKACEDKDLCNVLMSFEDTKILGFNQYRKSDKAAFIIYAEIESLIGKINGCKNNPEKSSMAKVSEHIPSGFSMTTISSFKNVEHKHDVYKGKDCMKKFCKSLREYAIKIINFKKKKKKLLTKKLH